MYKVLWLVFIFLILFSCGEVTIKQNTNQQTETKNIEVKKQHQRKYYSKPIDSLEFAKFSLDTLRLKRNEIFARKGLIFKSEDLQKYFAQFDWYAPKYENVNDLLNDTDKSNIQIIQSIERFKSEKLAYFRNLPNLSDKKGLNNFLKVGYADYPFWDLAVPDSQSVRSIIYIIGKKEFDNCIYIVYFGYDCGPDETVPPAITYYYHIKVYDLSGNLACSKYFVGDDLDNFKIISNKLYFHTNVYESIYSEEEKGSIYYDELHVDKTGTEKHVFYFDHKNMTIKENN